MSSRLSRISFVILADPMFTGNRIAMYTITATPHSKSAKKKHNFFFKVCKDKRQNVIDKGEV